MFVLKYVAGILIAVLLTVTLSNAQIGNTLVLKEKGRTIQSWIEKDCITFRFSNTQWIEGKIKTILKDSLLINMYRAQQSPTVFGGFRVDTTWLGFLKISINEISGMPQSRYKSGMFTNGILFRLASGAYLFLNIANSVLKGLPLFDAANTSRLLVAAGFYGIGTLQKQRHKAYLPIGKKYTMAIY
ncbi:MAG: hypothetical protein ACO21X_00325 [Sediminibacterium sp.]|jgi:hypothetical protein